LLASSLVVVPEGVGGRESMNGATSPAGDVHPGTIRFEDRVAGRTWVERAEDNPQSMAWVEDGGTWIPVLRSEYTGENIVLYGPDDRFLQCTIVFS
jgi:hypothetical protein